MNAAAQPSLVQLSNVDLHLGKGASRVHVLKDISFTINQGETLGIIGPSGSGKSTLLMVLAGMERIDQGKLRIDQQLVSAMNEDATTRFRAENIGIVFQSFHLIPNMTALENVAVPLELAGNPAAFEVAKKALRDVGLKDRARHYPSQLSGGEQQRVAIARAIAPNPKILIADEPTGNLDGKTGAQIADLLFERAESDGLTLILVTHDTQLAARCSRRLHVENGRILEEDHSC